MYEHHYWIRNKFQRKKENNEGRVIFGAVIDSKDENEGPGKV